MIEDSIFANLIYNEQFSKSTLPYIKPEYFPEPAHKILFELINSFTLKYGKRPTPASLIVDLNNVTGFNDDIIQDVQGYLTTIKQPEEDIDWLIDNTEKFCKDKAIYNGVTDAIAIISGEDKNLTAGAIPQILSEALAVSFDNSIGHDYLEDFEQRFDFYHSDIARVPFDLEYMNLITGGGIPNKSLTCYVGATGTGKTIVMCHSAAANMSIGKNVLYVTMEMPEEDIGRRVDANLLDINISEIGNLKKTSKVDFMKKANKLREKVKGKIIIREYPTASCSASMIDGLLTELKIKKRFVPDIIYIDYINICKSDRLAGTNANSFAMIKAISEEFRGLAMKHNLPVVSATQVNREGIGSSDLTLTNISESIGLAFTCDLIVGLIVTDVLIETKQIMYKQLKNRHNDVNRYRKFTVGLDKSRMRLYDVEQTQKDLSEEGQKDAEDKKANFEKALKKEVEKGPELFSTPPVSKKVENTEFGSSLNFDSLN